MWFCVWELLRDSIQLILFSNGSAGVGLGFAQSELAHLALFHSASFPVVECLLAHGANVNARSTVRILCVPSPAPTPGTAHLSNQLIHVIPVGAQGYNERTLLEHAASRGRLDVVEHLVDAGVENSGTDMVSSAKSCVLWFAQATG